MRDGKQEDHENPQQLLDRVRVALEAIHDAMISNTKTTRPNNPIMGISFRGSVKADGAVEVAKRQPGRRVARIPVDKPRECYIVHLRKLGTTKFFQAARAAR